MLRVWKRRWFILKTFPEPSLSFFTDDRNQSGATIIPIEVSQNSPLQCLQSLRLLISSQEDSSPTEQIPFSRTGAMTLLWRPSRASRKYGGSTVSSQAFTCTDRTWIWCYVPNTNPNWMCGRASWNACWSFEGKTARRGQQMRMRWHKCHSTLAW